ncbi:MAG: diaminopimelate decarboxylase [Candidatus Obscuribacterales bacterium]|nr:diaminopimelate decarboxylase [Candidatus Obscuribacterales bacterium]
MSSESEANPSPNTEIRPSSCRVNEAGHLVIGGCDCTELAAKFSTPLWIIDEDTICKGIEAYKQGLKDYPDLQILYAGKAFLCLAMCHLVHKLGLGLDVVSEGELYTAIKAGFPAEKICMHGNNKSESELNAGLQYGDLVVVVDNLSELEMLNAIASKLGKRARILFRVIPGVEPDTHHHIKTGQHDSKFGISLDELESAVRQALALPSIDLIGLHAHIGSQAQEIEPYLENVDILADLAQSLKNSLNFELRCLDVGGGLGIKYSSEDNPISAYAWGQAVSRRVLEAFHKRDLRLPRLMVEPGRSIIGPAGVTLYTVGHCKQVASGKKFVSVDGGMADNPRPITYQSRYTAALANRANAPAAKDPQTIVGRYCESGDIIIKEAYLAASAGDLIAIFGTGAYNFSMASNYNRSPRPACVLVADGNAEIIVERESNEDLIRKDRVPDRFLR